jgi:hypothetical protein
LNLISRRLIEKKRKKIIERQDRLAVNFECGSVSRKGQGKSQVSPASEIRTDSVNPTDVQNLSEYQVSVPL